MDKIFISIENNHFCISIPNMKPKINFHIISSVPDSLNSYLNSSIIGRAVKNRVIGLKIHDLRKWGEGKYNKIDDKPYGGGPGMVIKINPVYKAIQSLKLKNSARIILFSTRGKKFDRKEAKRLSKYKNLILICGRYEGVDERVARYIADEEISLGDFILSGGEIPALAVVDSVSRFIPGVLGKEESLEENKGSFPSYTRPEIFRPDKKNKKKEWRVPKVLLSGDHGKIEAWRTEKSKVKG